MKLLGKTVVCDPANASAGFAGMPLYCSPKAGLSNSHRVLRHELAPCPARTTPVEVGPIPTDMLDDMYSLAVTERSFRRMRRLGLVSKVLRPISVDVIGATEDHRHHARRHRQSGALVALR